MTAAARDDRAAGVLVGTAVGDALGVPYEFGTPPAPGELAEMRGGGLIHGAAGEWSDDTSMAVAVARAAAGHDLTDAEGLTVVARGFLDWYATDPPDVGIQTRAVLAAVVEAGDSDDLGRLMATAAADYAGRHAHAAGNGALMRTAAVALRSLSDREQTARAARAVAELTHADPLAGDSCVLWSEAIRVAVAVGPEAPLAVDSGLDLLPEDRREQWAAWLGEAESSPATTFTPNGFTVTALQAALAAILSVPGGEAGARPFPAESAADGSVTDGTAGEPAVERVTEAAGELEATLHRAVRIGDDTDTVAAIAGGLLGARHGAASVPPAWRALVHGWPGLRADDLADLGVTITRRAASGR